MKFKIKCEKEKDYDNLKQYFDSTGIDYSQKEGKSLKVDCKEDKIATACVNTGVVPLSIKPCKNNKAYAILQGYRAHNNADGQGLVEDYDFISSTNIKLNAAFPSGIQCADDIKEYRNFMRNMDPSGLSQAVFENSKRRFTDYEDYEYEDDWDER